jgi:hypothetical protein
VIRNATIIIHWDPIGLEGVAENVGSKNDKVGVSDAVGHFSLELPPGVYDIFLSAGGFSPHCEKLSLRKNETRLYTVQLKVSRTLTVKVD